MAKVKLNEAERHLKIVLKENGKVTKGAISSLNEFSCESSFPMFTRFHTETCSEVDLIVCSKVHTLITKMATMPVYGKTHLKISQTKKALKKCSYIEWRMGILQNLFKL